MTSAVDGITDALDRIDRADKDGRKWREVRDRLVAAAHYDEGLTPGRIAVATGMSKSNVKRILRERPAPSG